MTFDVTIIICKIGYIMLDIIMQNAIFMAYYPHAKYKKHQTIQQ